MGTNAGLGGAAYPDNASKGHRRTRSVAARIKKQEELLRGGTRWWVESWWCQVHFDRAKTQTARSQCGESRGYAERPARWEQYTAGRKPPPLSALVRGVPKRLGRISKNLVQDEPRVRRLCCKLAPSLRVRCTCGERATVDFVASSPNILKASRPSAVCRVESIRAVAVHA